MDRIARYRDPITRNVARLLLRSLQEQHRAPSSTVIEFEARLGQLMGNVSVRRTELPIATATTAILDSSLTNLYTFVAGVNRSVSDGIHLALIDKGFAAPADFPRRGSVNEVEDVLLMMDSYKRIVCTYGELAELEAKARRARQRAGATSVESRGGGGAASTSTNTARLVAENPFSLTNAIQMQSAAVKKRLAHVDVVCPGWAADLRLAISSEKSVPLALDDITLSVPVSVRHRNRIELPISAFFSLHLSHSYMTYDLWWHPAAAKGSAHAACDTATIFPAPNFRVAEQAKKASQHSLNSSRRYQHERETVLEVEVEVNVPALLRAWKKNYGGAAASAYLSSAELVGTTLAGTPIAPAPSAVGESRLAFAEARAFAMAEREDPFLVRVAEEYLSLLQFLSEIRVFE